MEKLPINPEVLRWARETSGLAIEDVSGRMKKDSRVIESWEKGETSPTYVQLEKLAYQIYKRPIALFFFPSPPEELTPKQSFRTLPDAEIGLMTSRLRFLIRQAHAMQMNLYELNEGVNPASTKIIQDLRMSTSISAEEMAGVVRKFLGIDLKKQMTWQSTEEAFKAWRDAFEDVGISIFKEAFKEDEAFSGFCLYDQEFPIIYVNNSKSFSRQIFTLFHELAHLLLGTGGVDTRLEDYIGYLKGEDKKTEILCNSFGGAFLVPNSDFDSRIANIEINDQAISKLASLYSVSREVILRKLLDKRTITQDFYSQKVDEWETIRKPRGKKGGGNFYNTQGAYLGERYLGLVYSKAFQKGFSSEQLAEYLNVKVKHIAGMEALLYKKGFST